MTLQYATLTITLLYTSDGSSVYSFKISVWAVVEFSANAVAVTVFRCLTTAVAVVDCDEHEN